MKQFDSRTYSISDFVAWDRDNELQLNPVFQRRAVWSDKAKSYLMDTIIRGKPIPKIFIRQKLNVTTRTSVREVVDGQQRLRTILSFIKDGFVISPRHNKEFGGIKFSQMDEKTQTQILTYEIAVDLLINLSDADILDIFGRLNSYAVVLNDQEKINADHFSEFKILADNLGRKYNKYWELQGILTSASILRMQEVSLVADLLIAMQEGIKSKKQIRKYYDQYEKNYPFDSEEMEIRFDSVIDKIGRIFPEGLMSTEFRRLHLFYSLFSAIAHALYGLPNLVAFSDDLEGLTAARVVLQTEAQVQVARNGLDHVAEVFTTDNISNLSRVDQQFLEDSRRATTDEPVRVRRAKYLLGLMQS